MESTWYFTVFALQSDNVKESSVDTGDVAVSREGSIGMSVDIDIDEENGFAAGSDFSSGSDDDEDEDIEHDYNLDVDSSYHGDMNLDFELVDDTLLDLVCQHQLDEEAKETSEAQTFSANSLRGPTTMYLDDLFDTCLEQNSSGRVITSVAEHGV
ncbi:hypothetical protein PC111_g6501 [Phytophthora cactorum]|nr:hypothetical protein PC112_g9473 [Phytophthora cactorum]KAG2832640.1 hypothetical protein PC111_g6501 [Phytophthora cactorum]KAG4058379.1 hypothetical protein PC123_g6667 [Phytophthora cactorum]